MGRGSEWLGKQVQKSLRKHTTRPEDSKGKFSYGEPEETLSTSWRNTTALHSRGTGPLPGEQTRMHQIAGQ